MLRMSLHSGTNTVSRRHYCLLLSDSVSYYLVRMVTWSHMEWPFSPLHYLYQFCRQGEQLIYYILQKLIWCGDCLSFEHLAKCTYKTIWTWGFIQEVIFVSCFNFFNVYVFKFSTSLASIWYFPAYLDFYPLIHSV